MLGQKVGQTDTVTFHRPSSACYANSANDWLGLQFGGECSSDPHQLRTFAHLTYTPQFSISTQPVSRSWSRPLLYALAEFFLRLFYITPTLFIADFMYIIGFFCYTSILSNHLQ